MVSINMGCECWQYVAWILALPTIMWSIIYLGELQILCIISLQHLNLHPFIICFKATNLGMLLGGPVDLKKKYNAKWALVTGAGTGIGKSIAETMALQGLNVVLVSLGDKVMILFD